MKNPFIFIGSLVLLDAVIVGAFGAHTLKNMLSEGSLDSFETGVKYQFYHGLGLFMLGVLGDKLTARMRWAGWLMFIGIFCFSGSIYILACRDILGINNVQFLGPITPIGGVLFIIAWALIAWDGLRKEYEL